MQRNLSSCLCKVGCLLRCAGKGGLSSHGELLLSVFLEFWLTDGEDPSLKGPRDSRMAPSLPYEAPTADLLAALQVIPMTVPPIQLEVQSSKLTIGVLLAASS